ncbi:hypothetical protein IC582_020059 [Cucumis melo]
MHSQKDDGPGLRTIGFRPKKKGIPGPRTFAYVPDVVPYIFTQSIGRKTNSLGE